MGVHKTKSHAKQITKAKKVMKGKEKSKKKAKKAIKKQGTAFLSLLQEHDGMAGEWGRRRRFSRSRALSTVKNGVAKAKKAAKRVESHRRSGNGKAAASKIKTKQNRMTKKIEAKVCESGCPKIKQRWKKCGRSRKACGGCSDCLQAASETKTKHNTVTKKIKAKPQEGIPMAHVNDIVQEDPPKSCDTGCVTDRAYALTAFEEYLKIPTVASGVKTMAEDMKKLGSCFGSGKYVQRGAHMGNEEQDEMDDLGERGGRGGVGPIFDKRCPQNIKKEEQLEDWDLGEGTGRRGGAMNVNSGGATLILGGSNQAGQEETSEFLGESSRRGAAMLSGTASFSLSADSSANAGNSEDLSL